MLKKPEDCLNKSCLVGLSYYDIDGNLLKQNLLAGVAIKADQENGISFRIIGNPSIKNKNENTPDSKAEFILPTNFTCWFVAPKGEFHTSQEGVKIVDPDYLVTWDIYQTRNDKQDGEQQWWEWVPRTSPPQVGN